MRVGEARHELDRLTSLIYDEQFTMSNAAPTTGQIPDVRREARLIPPPPFHIKV